MKREEPDFFTSLVFMSNELLDDATPDMTAFYLEAMRNPRPPRQRTRRERIAGRVRHWYYHDLMLRLFPAAHDDCL